MELVHTWSCSQLEGMYHRMGRVSAPASIKSAVDGAAPPDTFRKRLEEGKDTIMRGNTNDHTSFDMDTPASAL